MMLLTLLTMVSAQEVPERHFFLENFSNMEICCGIRIAGAAILAFFVINVFRYKKK